jgi:hypothetical protein
MVVELYRRAAERVERLASNGGPEARGQKRWAHQYPTSTIVRLRSSPLGGRFRLLIRLAVAKALESEESSTVMQKNLATRFRLITPLVSSAFAFIVIFGWRW